MREPKIARRGFLIGSVLVGIAGGVATRFWARIRRVRPPGAAKDFAQRCIGCLRCSEVCPPRAILFDTSGRPHLEPALTACTLCMACTEVCPTDALEPIPNELSTIGERVNMGFAVVDRDLCLTFQRKATCRICHEVCPFSGDAIKLTGLGQGPAFFAEACVGCGICAEACPEDARAITILPPRESSG